MADHSLTMTTSITTTKRIIDHRGDTNNQKSPNDTSSKWVVNMSISPLTEPQSSLLAMGPKFAVVPRHPPKGEYIASVGEVCLCLPQTSMGVKSQYQQSSAQNTPSGQHYPPRSWGHQRT